VTAAETLIVVCRFVFYAGTLFLWGAAIYIAGFVPDRLRQMVWAKLTPIRGLSVFVLFLATAASLPLNAAVLGGSWQDAADPDVLWTVITQTGIGSAWIVQAIAAALLFAASTASLRSKIPPTALAALVALASLPISGHAAIHDASLRLLHRANDLLHLLSGGFWFGALLPVALLLPALRDHSTRHDATIALIGFSRAGHVAVALVIVTGLLSTWLIVGGLPLNWSLPYQLLLSAKILIVATMVALAIVNRYVFVRLLDRSPLMYRSLVCATVTEIGLSLGVLALVAYFGRLQPV
jgi:putative copper resistance protein D